MTHLSPRHHHPPGAEPTDARLVADAGRRTIERRWPEHRRARLPGRGRIRELAAAPTRAAALVGPASIRRAWSSSTSDRLVGLMMLRNEDDIVDEMLRVATQWFDRIFVLDGTTDPDRRVRTDAILAGFSEVEFVVRDDDVSDGRPVRDGARQFLLDEARHRYGVDQWIGLLHADEFMDQDPRPMLAAHNPLLDPTIRVRLVHAFLHTSDEPQWSADPVAWESAPVRERIRHVMWPGVPETRFFFDRGDRDYVVDHHSKTVPTSFRAGPIEHGFCIVQYNERSPSQAVERGLSRESTGWQHEHYARFLEATPTVFVESLDSPDAPFAPEFRGDPDGPFRVCRLDAVPAGPMPPLHAGTGGCAADDPAAGELEDLLDAPTRLAALRWRARLHRRLPVEFHALVDYTARLATARRLSETQRRRVALEFGARLAEAPRGDSPPANAVP